MTHLNGQNCSLIKNTGCKIIKLDLQRLLSLFLMMYPVTVLGRVKSCGFSVFVPKDTQWDVEQANKQMV